MFFWLLLQGWEAHDPARDYPVPQLQDYNGNCTYSNHTKLWECACFKNFYGVDCEIGERYCCRIVK